MNYEDDYIMRLIHEIIRMLVKLLMNVDMKSPMTELFLEDSQQDKVDRWCRMIDGGEINEAENELSELMEEKSTENLKAALKFYAYLNDKDDEFLMQNHFSREEIRMGLENLAQVYGVQGITDIFKN